ncbi:MAG: hypothetical protein LBR77_11170, partial [Lachnospiraceae bacterium]|nr:hypothetical protein [Lachnospiraceae bacterium]
VYGGDRRAAGGGVVGVSLRLPRSTGSTGSTGSKQMIAPPTNPCASATPKGVLVKAQRGKILNVFDRRATQNELLFDAEYTLFRW